AVAAGAFQVFNTAGKGYLGSFIGPDLAVGQFRLITGAAIVGALGAIFYWARPIFGVAIADLAGKGLAPLAGLAAVVWGAPLVISGLVGTDIRKAMFGLAGAGAFLLALVAVATLGAGLQALRTSLRGDVIGADAWGDGGTLEWTDLDQPTVTSAYPAL